MNISTFEYILNNIEKFLLKNWCNLHNQPIRPEEKLVITLRFLVTGLSFTSLSFSFKIGKSTVHSIIHECLEILWLVMQPKHMAIPTHQDFLRISNEFYYKWNIPNCIGSIDGKHIRIKKPAHSGSLYYNYKKYFSSVLQAVVDARARFIIIDVAPYGSHSDSAIFNYSQLRKAIINNLLDIPLPSTLPRSTEVSPYFIIGDGGYPLQKYLIKPFRGTNLTAQENNFNYRLSRARVIAENAFARLTQKWNIFYTQIQLRPDGVDQIIKAACILHNIILDSEASNDVEDISECTLDSTLLEDVSSSSDSQLLTQLQQGMRVRSVLLNWFQKNSF
uniref:DDE Tnp4 domain-containing protein n=1 Tax=Trichogramma kaykai TaxID=54128 RepID=A0ABD2WFE8_9HYME